MADAIYDVWVYPPLYSGTPPANGGWLKVVRHITCISDGTGETNVVKVDLSTLRMPDGQAPLSLAVESVRYSISGFTSITLKWDRISDIKICTLPPHSAYLEFNPILCLNDSGADGTGDIILTSAGASAGDTYDITLTLKLKR